MPDQPGAQPTARLSVLVTGCSSGFGDLIARTLATDGHRVYATMRGVQSRNATAAQNLRQWSREQSVALDVLELDVTRDDLVQSAVAHILASADGIDVVVNNAGAAAVGPLEAFSIEQMAGLLSVNVLGPMRVNNAVLPTMRARQSGLIVWITSTLGRVLPGRGGLYPATKWAAEGFAESLHYQVAPFGIDVAIVEPGSFPTPATFKSIEAANQEIAAAYAARAPANATARQPTPAGHQPPDPQEVADAVKRLIELPAGQRPLRTVVGQVFTEGVAEYNETYEQVRTHLQDVLRRPDQAITWTRTSVPPAR
ncbi:MAG TPA: SDR family oxidoreductase, partial [Chloroflexota bacterium]|nr:SDR family oxidoreductase [Chloroflexota bacterium]